MSIDSDLDAMLAGWDSRSVQLGEFDGRGLLDQMDEMDQSQEGDPVLKRVTVLKLRRQDFLDGDGVCTVARGDTATVDGIAYTVGDIRMGSSEGGGGEEIDGRELHLILRKVAR